MASNQPPETLQLAKRKVLSWPDYRLPMLLLIGTFATGRPMLLVNEVDALHRWFFNIIFDMLLRKA